MTQAELAGRNGLTRQAGIAVEQGRYSPTLEMAFRVARVFEVPLRSSSACVPLVSTVASSTYSRAARASPASLRTRRCGAQSTGRRLADEWEVAGAASTGRRPPAVSLRLAEAGDADLDEAIRGLARPPSSSRSAMSLLSCWPLRHGQDSPPLRGWRQPSSSTVVATLSPAAATTTSSTRSASRSSRSQPSRPLSPEPPTATTARAVATPRSCTSAIASPTRWLASLASRFSTRVSTSPTPMWPTLGVTPTRRGTVARRGHPGRGFAWS
jgi:transcriptional regulator with XRE-family HTH domain